jgi:uncharacterized protein YlxW (UPF0749 family)
METPTAETRDLTEAEVNELHRLQHALIAKQEEVEALNKEIAHYQSMMS